MIDIFRFPSAGILDHALLQLIQPASGGVAAVANQQMAKLQSTVERQAWLDISASACRRDAQTSSSG